MKNYVVWLENSIRYGETKHSSFDYILVKEVSDSGEVLDSFMIPQDYNPFNGSDFNIGLACKSWKNALGNFKKQIVPFEPVRLIFFNFDQHRKLVDMNSKYNVIDIEDCVVIDKSKYYDESINYSNSSAENLYKVCNIIKKYGIEEIKISADKFFSRNNQGKLVSVGKLGRVTVEKNDRLIISQIETACEKLGFSYELDVERLIVKTLTGDFSINIYNRPCEINVNQEDGFRKILTECYSPIDALIELKKLEAQRIAAIEDKFNDRRII